MPEYIYQQPGWPRFFWDKKLTDFLLPEILQCAAYLDGLVSATGFRPHNAAAADALAESIVRSAAIEGERLDWGEIRSSIANKLGIKTKDKTSPGLHSDSLADMMLDAVNNCNAPLSAERLYSWHRQLFPEGRSGFMRISVGQYRDDCLGPMQVVSGPIGMENVHYQTPPSADVPKIMEQFFYYANNYADNDIIKAAVLHLHFVSIHPFDDGNGRIARAVSDMFLSRACNGSRFFSMSAQIQKEKKGYYSALEKAQHGTLDITEWILWFLGCLKNAIKAATVSARKTIIKHRFLQNAEEKLNARQKKMLGMLFDGFNGNLTSSKWAKINKVTQMTANRDITQLLELGLLAKQGQGRTTHYVLSENYLSE